MDRRLIPNHPGYFADDSGVIWLNRGGVFLPLKQHPNRDGVACVSPRVDGRCRWRRVHALVLLAFVGPRPAGQVCIHGREGKRCNALRNLRYGTRSEQAREAIARGTANCVRRGADHPGHANALPQETADKIVRLLEEGAPPGEVAKQAGVRRATVSKVRRARCPDRKGKLGRRRIVDAIAPAVCDLIRKGKRTAEIAAELGVCDKTILTARRLGCPGCKSPVSRCRVPAVIAQVGELLRQGHRVGDVARALGIGKTTVGTIRAEHFPDLKLRRGRPRRGA